MADENRIGFDIVVDTRASSDNVTTLKQDINNLQAAIEKASKTGLDINIDGIKRSIEEAQKIQGEFISRLNKLNDGRLDVINKNATKEAEAFRKASEEKIRIAEKENQLISDLKAKQNKASLDQYYKDIELQQKESSDKIKRQMESQSTRGTDYFSSEKQRINSNLQNAYYDLMVKDNNKAGYAKVFAESKKEAQELTRQVNQMGKAFENSGGHVVNFGNKLRSHLYWIAAGGLLGAITAVPYEVFNQLKELEVNMAGVNQVLDHNKMANEAAALGVNEHTYVQQQLNSEQQKFIQIASAYGESVNDIIKAGNLWGRTYKEIDVVNSLVAQSTKLAVADNFSMADANKYVEAAMFQYGLTAKNTSEALAYSGNVIDVWTKLAHNAGASAQDIAKGVEQAGSAAHIAGADFEFLSAQIATGVRATGKSGNEIGTMLKSLYTSFHSDKAIAELGKLGVSIYKIGEDGSKQFRKAQDVMLDLSVAAQETDKSLENVYKQVAGGRHICPPLQ